MTEYDPNLVERMVACLRKAVDKPSFFGPACFCEGEPRNAWAEAKAILAKLPKPVDPDLLLAREVVRDTLTLADHLRCHCRDEIDAGEWDKGHKVRAALAAIKRVRQQEAG